MKRIRSNAKRSRVAAAKSGKTRRVARGRTSPVTAAKPSPRAAEIRRTTGETDVKVSLDVDGSGTYSIETGLPFFDHMLELFARHGFFDLTIAATGDLEVDPHHTVEDVGLTLGQAFREALGDKAGIRRFGEATVPLDDALVKVVVDVSGRPYLVYDIALGQTRIGTFDVELVRDYLRALTTQLGMNLHVTCERGRNPHHIIEAAFKGLARALDVATERDPRVEGVLSTKGRL